MTTRHGHYWTDPLAGTPAGGHHIARPFQARPRVVPEPVPGKCNAPCSKKGKNGTGGPCPVVPREGERRCVWHRGVVLEGEQT